MWRILADTLAFSLQSILDQWFPSWGFGINLRHCELITRVGDKKKLKLLHSYILLCSLMLYSFISTCLYGIIQMKWSKSEKSFWAAHNLCSLWWKVTSSCDFVLKLNKAKKFGNHCFRRCLPIMHSLCSLSVLNLTHTEKYELLCLHNGPHTNLSLTRTEQSKSLSPIERDRRCV